jgi:DNA primase
MSDFIDNILRVAATNLQHAPQALSYLRERGVSEAQIDGYGIGYFAEDQWPPYIPDKNATQEERHYLSKSKKGFSLKGKLLFPFTNALGMIKGFQTRTPDSKSKDYWKYHLPNADEDAVFFGTSQAMGHIWNKKSVVVVEGIFDIFPVARHVPFTICAATSSFTPNQISFLRRYVRDVFFMSDNDAQGDDFYWKFAKTYGKDFNRIDRIEYHGKDPSESWSKLGEVSFSEQLKPYIV